MYGDNPNDEQLRQAWSDFCAQLQAAGETVFRDTAPIGDLDRAKGLRLMARNIALGLQFHLDNNDPACPELLHYFDPLRKQGGDNADALYVGAPVDGAHTYRISGQRGTARYFAVTVLEDGVTPWGGAVVGSLVDDEIDVAEDGSFEIVLSPDEHPGNWIRTTPGAWRVTVRQFFADWVNEAPMDARIDCLDAEAGGPRFDIDTLCQGLDRAANWVRASTTYWADMLDRWQARPNHFLSYRQLDDNAIDATPGGEPLICYWRVPADEALLVRVTPPAARFWSVEFGNYWWETMDYRYRLCSTNCHHAVLEDSGELLLVVAHDDPGVPNWLDPSGHGEGYITVRWIGAAECPTPHCEQVPLGELAAHLPEGVKRIDAQGRRAQLAERRAGAQRRFRY
ncbi:MAG: hypothetical protein CME59_18815 [Halioglobus sp.]|nr:hypothetical protein [Halioglobus sp.]|tara:strand:+ start:1467 stop:2654 length:1188 start_codon:yes stop_codon:yes gene_type:complete